MKAATMVQIASLAPLASMFKIEILMAVMATLVVRHVCIVVGHAIHANVFFLKKNQGSNV